MGDLHSNRIQERLNGHNAAAEDYVREMTALTGEYIDAFTTVDLRPYEILNRVPKCCIGVKSTWPTEAELAEKWKLKPATERDTSRDKQEHKR